MYNRKWLFKIDVSFNATPTDFRAVSLAGPKNSCVGEIEGGGVLWADGFGGSSFGGRAGVRLRSVRRGTLADSRSLCCVSARGDNPDTCVYVEEGREGDRARGRGRVSDGREEGWVVLLRRPPEVDNCCNVSGLT